MYREPMHKVKKGQHVLLFLHQTHDGPPYTNTHSISATEDTPENLELLKQSLASMSGTTRIVRAEVII